MLTRVTITGADDSVEPQTLAALSHAYPFVEWGLLVSRRHWGLTGAPRFPSRPWLTAFRSQCRRQPLQCAVHVCGSWARDLLLGDVRIPKEVLGGCQRVQLNLGRACVEHGPRFLEFSQALDALGQRQLIFQLAEPGTMGHEYLDYAASMGSPWLDVVPLFDASGGQGKMPVRWPTPADLPPYLTFPCYGYAGALGPATLGATLPRIAEAAGEATHWIDMETGVRTEDHRCFDLAKVEEVLTMTAPFVKG